MNLCAGRATVYGDVAAGEGRYECVGGLYVEAAVSVVVGDCVCGVIRHAMSEFRVYYGCMLFRADVSAVVGAVWAAVVTGDFPFDAVGCGSVCSVEVGTVAEAGSTVVEVCELNSGPSLCPECGWLRSWSKTVTSSDGCAVSVSGES